jgi:mycothiol synthase
VHPDYLGRGLGRRLLDELESNAIAMRDAEAPGLPGEMKVWLDPQRPRTAALVAAAGYQYWRYFFRMRRDLHDPVQRRSEPAGVEIRPYRPSDDDAVRLVSNSSFGDHWGSTPLDPERWRAEYADSSSFRPERSWVAVISGSVAGFVLTSEFEVDTCKRGYPTGYISRVGTLRSARGRGIAGALLARTLAGLADAGCRYAELGVDADSQTGAGRLYERAGFATIGQNIVAGKHF